MVFLNKGYTDIYKTENIEGVPVYVVENNYIRVQLTSNKIEKNMLRKIGFYDYKHLDTIAKMLTNKDILTLVYSKAFNMSDLYIYIRLKAAQDKDFLRWFKGYGFKINLFRLNKQPNC